MGLYYKGRDKVRSVNGRPLMHGEEITDPQEIKDLTEYPDFGDKFNGVVIDNPPMADEPESAEE